VEHLPDVIHRVGSFPAQRPCAHRFPAIMRPTREIGMHRIPARGLVPSVRTA
jgi:hypothetical protein